MPGRTVIHMHGVTFTKPNYQKTQGPHRLLVFGSTREMLVVSIQGCDRRGISRCKNCETGLRKNQSRGMNHGEVFRSQVSSKFRIPLDAQRKVHICLIDSDMRNKHVSIDH